MLTAWLTACCGMVCCDVSYLKLSYESDRLGQQQLQLVQCWGACHMMCCSGRGVLPPVATVATPDAVDVILTWQHVVIMRNKAWRGAWVLTMSNTLRRCLPPCIVVMVLA
jgi:hypothetical protein